METFNLQLFHAISPRRWSGAQSRFLYKISSLPLMSTEITAEFLEQLKEAIANRDKRFIIATLQNEHAVDIAEILDSFDTESCQYIFTLLPDKTCAEILSHLEEDTRRDFLRVFASKEIAHFMDFTDSDDAADILNQQPVKVREEVLALMNNREKANHIIDLLHYDEDCAGGLMATELVKCNINWTVKQCIEEIRRQAERVEKVLTVYVVDDQGILLGRVSLKKIILSRDEMLIKDIYIPEIATVQTYYEAEQVAEIMQKYDMVAVPVVNVQGRLLGRITIDDIVDVITEQAELDKQIMSGISEDIEADDSVWMLSRARLPWLIVGMLGGLLGARFIGLFEADLALVPAMAFFIPLITATGGNVGIQSSTIVVQALANQSSSAVVNPYQRLLKAVLVALLNGLIIALLVFAFNLFFSNTHLALVVSIALFSVVLLASLMGTVTPILLNKAKINPALASGPFITTTNDLLGLGVYFIVARLLL